jgi:hypothetical protein
MNKVSAQMQNITLHRINHQGQTQNARDPVRKNNFANVYIAWSV